MQMNRILCLFISMFSIFGNNCNANDNNEMNDDIVTLEVTERSEVLISYKDKGEWFERPSNPISEVTCSEKLNTVSDGYFNASSFKFENNKLIIKNITNTKPCTLLLKCDAKIKPDIVLDFGDNKLNFNEIMGYGLNSLRINSNKQLLIKHCLAVNSTIIK